MITKYSYGQDHVCSKKDNVIKQYKQSKTEEIRADLQQNRSDIVMILQHIDYNINIGSVIRSNNAFLGKEIYIVGRRRYDKRGCAGTYHYEHVYHADNLLEVVNYLHSLGYTIYAVDNIMEYHPVNLFDEFFPRKSAFVFGEEGNGLSDEEIQLCDKMIYIGMYGSVRSLNVACAATVIEFEYCRRFKNS
jgi:tRNA G18 (ribose-2'-O)-methylase SpoU